MNTKVVVGSNMNILSDLYIRGNTTIQCNGCVTQAGGDIKIDISERSTNTEIMSYVCQTVPNITVSLVGESEYCVSYEKSQYTLTLIYETCRVETGEDYTAVIMISVIVSAVVIVIIVTLIVVKAITSGTIIKKTPPVNDTVQLKNIANKAKMVDDQIESVTNDVNRLNSVLDQV